MHVRRFATCVEVQTPAKLNLVLDILAKRADGYHEIETLIVALDLYDTLILQPTNDGEIRLNCRWAAGALAAERHLSRQPTDAEPIYGEIPSGPKNLVWRAIELIRQEASNGCGADIQLIKRIPAAAGLGGGSSDPLRRWSRPMSPGNSIGPATD